MTKLVRKALVLASLLSLFGASSSHGGNQAAARPLHEKSFDEILRRYTFVADFNQKEPERPVSDEIFWRYPFTVPKVEFPILNELDEPTKELPASKGDGRAISHLNQGRLLYLEGNLDEAKATWLGARARYGQTYPYHRRADYFLGLAFMNIAARDMKLKSKAADDSEVKPNWANATTFLNWAFIIKRDHPDALLEEVTPKQLYNLAAIYWRFGRFSGAYGAAETGLNFLRKTGRRAFRPQFHRIVAEAHIKNRTYLEAVQQLDTAIRQDLDKAQVAAMFARVGDIYFDLNNYELAEDAYGLGARIDEQMRQINPAQLVLRGESLFWLGQFSEAQKILHYAIEGIFVRDVVTPLSEELRAWASLRIADSYLARHEYEDAKLAYYKVGHEFRNSLPGRLAKVREACLELPHYRGNNIRHARELLEEAKVEANQFPHPAVELAWACQVGSYTERERSPEMLERVKNFALTYPESRFLGSFVEPVREFQASHIKPYFDAKDNYRARSFFEKNRKTLFPKVPLELKQKLFIAYVDTYESDKAKEFWSEHRQLPETDLRILREATVAAELHDKKTGKIWDQRNQSYALDLPKREWKLGHSEIAANYVTRLMNGGSSSMHLPWMLNLAQVWSQKNADYVCDLEYPIMSRLYDEKPAFRERVTKRVAVIITNRLPALFKDDESCALSLLDLEAKAHESAPEELAKLYLARKDWPLTGSFLHLYWTIAEHVYDRGAKAGATSMWKLIQEKGPAQSPEVEFAKARLDKTKTEVEQLWD